MNRCTSTIVAVITIFAVGSAQAKTVHVKLGGTGDGSSWASAYGTLQEALDDAEPNDNIWVAEGTYVPTELYDPCDPRSATFQMKNGVGIYGGFPATGDPNREDRSWEEYETVLSGDLLENDHQGAGLLDDNSLHIVTAIDIEGEVVLDGFTIQGGNANGDVWEDKWGGGMSIAHSQVLIQNCHFEGNLASTGAALLITEADSSVIDCVFSGNKGGCVLLGTSASVFQRCVFENNQGHEGGAVRSGRRGEHGAPSFLDCVFFNNRASWYGGAVLATWGDRPTFQRCQFINNHATLSGGAVSAMAHYVAPVFQRCLFAGNQALGSGGALHLEHARARLEYCTFVNNQAENGGGAIHSRRAHLTVSNSILWYNHATEGPEIYFAHFDDSSLNVMYCNVEGGLPDVALVGTAPVVWQYALGHDIAAHDPRFVEAGSWRGEAFTVGDYRLKSQGGRYDPTTQSWVYDDVTSPCIDAGDPMSPIGTEPFPNGGVVNLGAYGGTAEASKSYFGKPPCQTKVAGDVNGDCVIDLLDFRLMALHWCEDNSP